LKCSTVLQRCDSATVVHATGGSRKMRPHAS